MTKSSTEPNDMEKQLSDFFRSLHVRYRWTRLRVARFFRRHPQAHRAVKGLEPVLAGFVFASLFLFLPLFGVNNANELLEHFVNGAMEHADSRVADAGMLFFGIALMAVGSPIGSFLRRAVAAPILRLAHHGLGVADGGLALVASAAILSGELTGWRAVALIFIVLVFGLLVVGLHFVVEVATGQALNRLGRLAAFRMVAALVGVAICWSSVTSLRNPKVPSKSEPKCAVATPSTTPPASAASAAVVAPSSPSAVGK